MMNQQLSFGSYSLIVEKLQSTRSSIVIESIIVVSTTVNLIANRTAYLLFLSRSNETDRITRLIS